MTEDGVLCSTLTRQVAKEVLSWFPESWNPVVADSVIGMTKNIKREDLETAEGRERIKEALRGHNQLLWPSIESLLIAYDIVRKQGGKPIFAGFTGEYVCVKCGETTFRMASQAIAPCRCGAVNGWKFYWFWREEMSEKGETVVCCRRCRKNVVLKNSKCPVCGFGFGHC